MNVIRIIKLTHQNSMPFMPQAPGLTQAAGSNARRPFIVFPDSRISYYIYAREAYEPGS
jgi:hypothetical protein